MTDMPAKKNVLHPILLLAVGLVVGYGAGRLTAGPSAGLLSLKGGSYQEGYEAAKKKLADSGLFPPPPTESRVLNGTVKEVLPEGLMMEVALRSPNPLEEIDVPKTRTVLVSESTEIVSYEGKDPEQFRKELEAFQKKADASVTTQAAAPSPTVEKKLALKDLKAGDTVTVSASEDILTLVRFTAVKIVVGPDIGPSEASAPPDLAVTPPPPEPVLPTNDRPASEPGAPRDEAPPIP